LGQCKKKKREKGSTFLSSYVVEYQKSGGSDSGHVPFCPDQDEENRTEQEEEEEDEVEAIAVATQLNFLLLVVVVIQ
jgi:hypothetical protein